MSSLEAGGGAATIRVGSGLGDAEAEACRGASGCGCATFCLLEARGMAAAARRGMITGKKYKKNRLQNREQEREDRQDRREWTGQDGTGQDGTGQDGTGQDGTGQDGTGQGNDQDGVKANFFPRVLACFGRVLNRRHKKAFTLLSKAYTTYIHI